MSDAWLIRLMRFVPKNLLSRVFGWIARARRPRFFVRGLNRFWVRRFDVDLSEAGKPIEDYDSLLAFFTRELRSGVRPINEDQDVLVSPVDARVGAFGEIVEGRLLQAKGMDYTLTALLGDAATAERCVHGHYVTLYLSPRDYHRIHAPRGGSVTRSVYEPGTLWPVNAAATRLVPQLFAINERITSWMETDRGGIAVVMVGATNVGSIQLSYDGLTSNRGGARCARAHDPAIPVGRGDHLGTFELGSTVVLVIEDRSLRWEGLEEGMWIPMGSPIGRFVGGER